MSTALNTERCNRPRATVANQDLTVAPLEQTAAYAKEALPRVLDICTWGYASAPSLMYKDVSSCYAERSINVLETDTRHRTPAHPLRRRRPAAWPPTVTQCARNPSASTSPSSLASVRTPPLPWSLSLAHPRSPSTLTITCSPYALTRCSACLCTAAARSMRTDPDRPR